LETRLAPPRPSSHKNLKSGRKSANLASSAHQSPNGNPNFDVTSPSTMNPPERRTFSDANPKFRLTLPVGSYYAWPEEWLALPPGERCPAKQPSLISICAQRSSKPGRKTSLSHGNRIGLPVALAGLPTVNWNAPVPRSLRQWSAMEEQSQASALFQASSPSLVDSFSSVQPRIQQFIQQRAIRIPSATAPAVLGMPFLNFSSHRQGVVPQECVLVIMARPLQSRILSAQVISSQLWNVSRGANVPRTTGLHSYSSERPPGRLLDASRPRKT